MERMARTIPRGFGVRQSSAAMRRRCQGEKRQRAAALQDAGAPFVRPDLAGGCGM